MSKLYVEVNTDTIKNPRAVRGTEWVKGTVRYGSSKKALEFFVTWSGEEDDLPVISVTKIDGETVLSTTTPTLQIIEEITQ